MPILTDELGYTKNDMAMVLTVYSFTYMLRQFISGYMSDRWGPRLIVSTGLVIAVVANFTIGMYGSLLAFVFLMGVNGETTYNFETAESILRETGYRFVYQIWDGKWKKSILLS